VNIVTDIPYSSDARFKQFRKHTRVSGQREKGKGKEDRDDMLGTVLFILYLYEGDLK
jgi:hypothetical protein